MFSIGKYKIWLITNDDVQNLTKLKKDFAKNRLYIIIMYTILLYISNHCNVCRSLKVSISSISKKGGGDGIITSYSMWL